MSGKTTLVINSDSKDGQRAIESLIKEMTKLKEENKKIAEQNKTAAAEAKKQYEEKLAQIKNERDEKRKLAADKKEQDRIEAEAAKKAAQAAKEREKAERDAARESERIAKGKQEAWSRFTGTVLTMAGSYVSLNVVLGQANQLLERQSRLQEEIHSRSMALGQAQANTAINFAGLSEGDRKAASGIGGRVNLATGFGNRPALENAAGSLISGGATPKLAEKVLTFAAEIAPGNAQMVESLGSGIVDLQGSTGMSMEDSAGLLLSGAANSRVKAPGQVAKSLSKVTSSASSQFDAGGTALAGEESTALWATITKMRGDASGDESATLANNALTKLATFPGFGPDAPKTIMGRIEALQSDKQLAEKFLDYGGYRTQDPAIGRMLTDKEFGYSRMLKQIDENVGYDPNLGGAIKDLHDAQPDIGIMKAQNRLESLGEASADANRVEARIKIAEDARQKAHELLDPLSANYTYMGRLQAPGRATTDLLGSDEEQINKRVQDLRDLQTTFNTSPHDITPERREEIATILQQLVDTAKEQLRETQQMNNRQNKPTVSPQGMQEAN